MNNNHESPPRDASPRDASPSEDLDPSSELSKEGVLKRLPSVPAHPLRADRTGETYRVWVRLKLSATYAETATHVIPMAHLNHDVLLRTYGVPTLEDEEETELAGPNRRLTVDITRMTNGQVKFNDVRLVDHK